MSRSKNCPR